MSVQVLATGAEVNFARAEMRRRNIDYIVPKFQRILHKTRLIKGVNVGDVNKSWDVFKTIELLEKNVAKNAPIIDFGAYASETLCSLHKLGYSDLAGIDMNPNVRLMPYSESVRYFVGDFMNTTFANETFAAITAISVIEHGFCGTRLLREVSRILRPAGYFIASVDYWPDKIDTSGIKAFGVDWRIFSKGELLEFVAQAREFDLVPLGELSFEALARPADWYGRQYTYAWIALQKQQGYVGVGQTCK